MKIIHNPQIFDSFAEKYDIFSIFPVSMKPHMNLKMYDKNEFIFLQGYLLDGFYFHLEGNIKILHMLDDGDEVILRFSGGPRIYGGAEFFLGYPVSASLKTEETSYCFYLPFHKCRDTLRRDPDFLFYLGKNYAEVMHVSNHNWSINQLSPHKSRVASYILTLDSQEEILKDLKDIPLFLGIGYRHFLRILSSFVEEGMLEKTEQGYRAADFSRLKKLAKDRYLI